MIRSTGRAERDEHALDVNFSELEVGLDLEKGEREAGAARRSASKAGSIPGLAVAVGQPISHRIEHLVSGVRANLAVKIFGADLDQLRDARPGRARPRCEAIPGLVDIAVEQQTEIPQLVDSPKTDRARRVRTTTGRARALRRDGVRRQAGRRRGGRTSASTTWSRKLPAPTARDLELLASTPVDVRRRALRRARRDRLIEKTTGPNLINRENVQRRIVVTANVAGRDLRGAAARSQARVATPA